MSAAGGSAERLPLLAERLARSRRRTFFVNLLLSLAVAVAAGCLVLGIAQLAAAFGAPISDSATWTAIAAVAGFAIALAVTAARLPLPADIARRADRLFGLSERTSTAFELAGRNNPPSAIGTALLRDAETVAPTIDPRRLAPVRVDRIATILAAAALFLALAVAVRAIVGAVGTDRPASLPAAGLTAADQAQVSEDLRRVAALIADDADKRADPFLQAIARETVALSERVSAGEVVERSQLVAAVDRLARYAGDAYTPAEGARRPPEDLSRLLRDVSENLRAPTQETQTAEIDPSQPAGNRPAQAPGEPQAGSQESSSSAGEGQEGAETPDGDSLEPVRRGSGEPGDGKPGDAAEEEYLGPDYIVAALRAREEAARKREARGAQEAALAGAAEQAGAGDSRLAGEGVGPMDGAAPTEVDPFATAGELLLQDEIDSEGRRIRVEVPPQGKPVEIDRGEIVAGDWRPASESEVSHSIVPPADRNAVARYFRSLAEAND